jgi:hypothetical protein
VTIALVGMLSLPCIVRAQWDGDYEGVDSAADNMPNWLRWDSAIDDDWTLGAADSFKLNSPSVGYMSVDRVTNSADHGKTGNIWVRDPILNHADGFTMEVNVELMPNSEQNAFSMNYLDTAGSFGVQLSPGSITVGGLSPFNAGYPTTTVPFNTTNGFHDYYITELPNSMIVNVYVDGSTTPIASGQGIAGDYAVGENEYITHPRVLVGDESNDPNINANYVLNYVRYRRGASPPGGPVQSFPARVLPALPVPAVNESWTTGFASKTGQPLDEGWQEDGGSYWTKEPDGSTRLDGYANARLYGVPGWTNKSAVTIEARIKVMPDSPEQSFDLTANDTIGDIALVLSPDKVQLMRAFSDVGQVTVSMNTTDTFHTYRLTRGADGLLWDLYIDNNPTPAIADYHCGATQTDPDRIFFGGIDFPIYIPGAAPDVEISYIQWHDGANAPALNVPEPASLGIASLGLLVLSTRRRRQGRLAKSSSTAKAICENRHR